VGLLSQKRTLSVVVATAVVLGVGAVTVPAAFADDTGSIAGQITDNGNPVPNAFVTVYDTDFGWAGSATADSTGAFTVTGLAAGDYKVRFLVGSYSQWSSQKMSFEEADVITVTGGQTTTLNEAIRPYGIISGHVTNADGTPAVNVNVTASGPAASAFATTDSTGLYTLKYLATGSYRVEFRRDFSSPAQYANNKTNYLDADLIPVTVGAITQLDQTLLPYATVTGTITDNGQPVSGVQVTVTEISTGSSFSGSTDGAGQYRISVWPGTYIVSVRRGDLVQYVPGQLSSQNAQQFVVADGTAVIDEQLLPTGTITGVLTHADGSPVPFAQVTASNAAGSVSTSTNFQGQYTLQAYPGEYRIAFRTPYGTQWENGRSSSAEADPVTVVAGTSITVNEQLAPFGSVTVTAVDSLSGAPVNEFCIWADFGFACTTTGSVTGIDALPGRYRVSVSPQDGVHLTAEGTAEVSSGAPATLQVALLPGATLTTTMIDRKTHAPVANACLRLVEVTQPWRLGMTYGYCSDASGAVQASPLAPGTYKAFVYAGDGVHGHQWVGNGGSGVGQFTKARTITISTGQAVTLPTIKLDKAGTITGIVRDELTGAPVSGGVVGLASHDYGYGDGDAFVGIDSQGRYTIPNLGPYQWTLLFSASGYAQEWTGDTPNRNKAATVKVKEGKTTTYNTSVGLGTTVSGEVFWPDGTPATNARLHFVNAESAENMGVADTWQGGGAYTAQVKGPQHVKIFFHASVNGQSYSGWIGGTEFANARVFVIPRTPTHTLNITIPAPPA
jgi:hypothetical protein